MLSQRKNWWVDGREEKGEKESRSGQTRGKDEQEAWYLLRHDLFDLWFHVAIHRFGFKTNKHTAREWLIAQGSHHRAITTSVHYGGFAAVILTSESSSSQCKQEVAYRVAGCNIWRKPHPWVCRGRGTGGDWDRWCGQPESEWKSLWLCRA